MKNVVINRCFGGFGLSDEAVREYAKLKGFDVFGYVNPPHDFNSYVRIENSLNSFLTYWVKEDAGDNPTNEEINKVEWLHQRDIPRDDEALIKVVKTLKKKANGRCADLQIVKIPDDVEYEISELEKSKGILTTPFDWLIIFFI